MIFFVAFLWGVAEGTVFFIVPDVFLTLVAIRSLRKALIAAVFATAGALAGGTIMVFFAAWHPASARELLVSIPAIHDRMLGEVGEQIAQRGAIAVFLGPLRGVPYKIYAVQWAWLQRPLATFLLVSVPARAIRFVLTSVLTWLIASALRRRVRERTLVFIHLLAWTVFYTVYFASFASAQSTIPATPAGVAMTRFLSAYNGGKLAGDPTWAPRVALYGRLRFERVATSLPYDLRVWTKSEITETWVSVRMILRSEPPHDVQDIRVGTGLRPLGLAKPPPLSMQEAVAAIDAYLARLAAADAFSGAVLIAKNGVPLYEKALGLASKRYAVRNTVETKFNIGSVTKLLTAVAVAQLADAGKLSFSDPLRKFLSNYPSEATIHQLLTHSAGLAPSRFQQQAFTDRTARTIGEQVPMTIETPDFVPGTRARYSNEGYLLLGAIIEKASGESYYDYVDRHIVHAAGMTGSGAFEGDRDVADVATGYTFWRWSPDRDPVFERGERRNTTFMTALRGNPSGGTVSTVRDLNRLVQAIERCAIVSCAARDAMLKEQVPLPRQPWSSVQQGYGYGVETRTVDGVELVGKSGDLAGASAQVSIDRRRGITIIVLSNYDAIAQPASEVIEEIVRRVP